MATSETKVTAMNTRIVLRNDMLSAWEASTKKLLKGEMALARLSGELSDKYQIRIGTGTKTWKELSSSNFMIPAENVEGLVDSINAVQTKFYEVSAFSELPTTGVTNGSIGVVLETVTVAETDPEYASLSADGKQLSTQYRTAYWFDTELSAWRQMDGNYKAENVYFTENLKLTEQFGKHQAVATGYTLSCKNMSLDAVLKEAYAETKQPTITQPSWEFVLEKTSSAGEVGTSYTLPTKARFKFVNDGNYEYGPATGVTTTATLSGEAKTGMASVTSSDMVENNVLSGTANVTSVYTSEAASYKYYASYSATAGVQPLNNIGGASTKTAIAAKAETLSTLTFTATGIYPIYMYASNGESTAPTTLSSSQATSINLGTKTIEGKSVTNVATLTNNNTWYKYVSTTKPTTFYFNQKKYQNFYVMVPGSSTGWTGKKSNNVNAINTVAPTEATVTFNDGTTKAYTVLAVTNADVFADYAAFMTYK